jgi:preprotein translocase subunit SecD
MHFAFASVLFALTAVSGPAATNIRPDIEIHPTVDCDRTSIPPQPDPDTGRPLCISPEMVVSGEDIVGVSDSTDPRGKDVLLLKMSDKATINFARFTKGWVGKRAGIIIDGKLVSAPFILEPILGGIVQVSGLSKASVANLIERFKVRPPI